jgi:hypothetical protein
MSPKEQAKAVELLARWLLLSDTMASQQHPPEKLLELVEQIEELTTKTRDFIDHEAD